MKELTLLKLLDAGCYDSVLKLKIDLIRYKKLGLVFYKETLSGLDFDQPFELYFHATKGSITYQGAFPIPVDYFKPWMRKRKKMNHLLPYYQSYYETKQHPDSHYFETLSHYKGEKFVWLYKEGAPHA
ncbi:hypothetical protein V7266_27500 [Neobacillus drentensis]|uniref:hypothetical protein n=1 Tax=Neobacillus drentensis TaxID=220684 RepID=UPI002FFEC6EB